MAREGDGETIQICHFQRFEATEGQDSSLRMAKGRLVSSVDLWSGVQFSNIRNEYGWHAFPCGPGQ